MSVLGKVLAFLNIVAALAFVYLATQVHGMRKAWAYSAYRHELVLDGVPLDGRVTDEEGAYLVNRLTPATLSQMLQGASVTTLKQEVERRKDELLTEVKQPESDPEKRRKLEQAFLLTARTSAERDEFRQQLRTEKEKPLEAVLERVFAPANDASLNDDARRQAIAHLLIALGEVPGNFEETSNNMKRAVALLGLRDYTRAMEGHAQNLRQIAQRTRQGSADDRGAFVLQYEHNVGQILDLAQNVDDLKRYSQDLQEQRAENHAALVAARKKDVADMEAELDAVRKARDAAQAKQAALEKTLFAIQRKLGEAAEKNLQLERDIRNLELGR